MATTMDKRMLIQAAPFAWLHMITPGETTPTIVEKYRFDNLSSPAAFMIPTVNASTAQEYQEVTRADNAIIQFPLTTLTINGVSEETVAGAAADTKATMSIETNEAPLPTSIASMTAFMADLQSNIDKYWLLTVATGFSNNSRSQATPKADGYAYMFGKIISNIEPTNDNGALKFKIDFEAVDLSGGDIPGLDAALIEEDTPATFAWTGIVWKGKGSTFTPKSFTAGDGTHLLAGKVLLKSDATYSYS
jgi:hypothetical protein